MSSIIVEVVYALPEKQYLYHARVVKGSSIKQAVLASGILEACKDIDLSQNKIGIYSRIAKLQDQVREGDRIEIYRPLLFDPKEWRRHRVKQSNKEKLFRNVLFYSDMI